MPRRASGPRGVRAVERGSSGALKALTRAYIPESFQAEALQGFGLRVRDFLTTSEYNVMRKVAPGRFERIVYANEGLREELMPALEALIKAKGMQLLVELDNWMSAQEKGAASALTRSIVRGRIRSG